MIRHGQGLPVTEANPRNWPLHDEEHTLGTHDRVRIRTLAVTRLRLTLIMGPMVSSQTAKKEDLFDRADRTWTEAQDLQRLQTGRASIFRTAYNG